MTDSTTLQIRFKRTTTNTDCTPTKSHTSDAGWDFYAAEAKNVPPLATCKVSLGVKCAIPNGYCILFAERSGLAANHSIRIGGGLIDAGYRGEFQAIVQNLDQHREFVIKEGMKIVQGLVLPVPVVQFVDVGEQELDITDRGTAGFGSTGVTK